MVAEREESDVYFLEDLGNRVRGNTFKNKIRYRDMGNYLIMKRKTIRV